ncbi:uncharacterized protein A4U43_C08F18330 [Asparagus officinalis]|uniref:uncharacterized protein LOC109819732 isoform X2 n=1 Tax=Asparagus officinalis TaxID=4686 RepID=UPI00098E3F5D|nr:uncharacterized protein LOC109819732 isoform X2 [Asparagus officinalis]ONK60425.1 uncharacterized protein A4U43_C08F18330 [Asparagus officinalis]
MTQQGARSGSGRKDKSKSSQRKLEKKLNFHAKVKDASVNLGPKKAINKTKLRSRQRKLKAYNLSALSEFLPDIEQPAVGTTNLKLNCKSRQKLVQRESAQMKAVLNNPVFQMDPILAIQHHLERTQPEPVVTEKKRKPNRPGSAKRKNKAKKGPSFMDM